MRDTVFGFAEGQRFQEALSVLVFDRWQNVESGVSLGRSGV